MNKIIFQIGLLAFCVAAVVYAIQEMSFLDVLARAFIIFMAAISAMIAIVFIASTFIMKDKNADDVNTNPNPNPIV